MYAIHKEQIEAVRNDLYLLFTTDTVCYLAWMFLGAKDFTKGLASFEGKTSGRVQLKDLQFKVYYDHDSNITHIPGHADND